MTWYSLSSQTPLSYANLLGKIEETLSLLLGANADVLSTRLKGKMGQVLKAVFMLSSNESYFANRYLKFARIKSVESSIKVS